MAISDRRRGSFWRAPRLRFDDLPTYGELLRQTDAKLLAKVVLAADLGVEVGELPKGKHAKKERREIEKTIREMREIEETRSDEDVLVAARRASESESDRPEVRVAAELVVREDLPRAAEVLEAESSWHSTYAGWQRWRERCRSGEVDETEIPRIGTWAYELSPREEILGYRCWIGQGFSRLEKYQYLADVFGEATFFGVDEEASQAAQKEIDDGIEKALEDVGSGARTVPVEVAMPDYGLAARGDDLEEEGWESTSDLCDYLNLVLQRDLHESMADLWGRLEAEEKVASALSRLGAETAKGERKRPSHFYAAFDELSDLPEDTAVTCSDPYPDGSVDVRVTTPDGRFAECRIPAPEWEPGAGLDSRELEEARTFVRNNVPLIVELARERDTSKRIGLFADRTLVTNWDDFDANGDDAPAAEDVSVPLPRREGKGSGETGTLTAEDYLRKRGISEEQMDAARKRTEAYVEAYNGLRERHEERFGTPGYEREIDEHATSDPLFREIWEALDDLYHEIAREIAAKGETDDDE